MTSLSYRGANYIKLTSRTFGVKSTLSKNVVFIMSVRFLYENKSAVTMVTKGFVCVFVYFSTCAVHIELVNDLTTDAFLNAMKPFIERHGICSDIYSDNSTNFVKANNKLQELKPFILVKLVSVIILFLKPGKPTDVPSLYHI